MWIARAATLLGILILTFGATACTPFEPTAPVIEAESVPKTCSAAGTGTVESLTQLVALSGIVGTSTADLQGFASEYNDIRMANCLATVPTPNFRLGSCVQQRLIWIAEDPSDDPLSAWGHDGTERSDGVPPVGCDANLAGGTTTTGELAAQKWWFSEAHRDSLYRPDYGGPMGTVCVDFAMAHGDIPHTRGPLNRAGAVWADCQPYQDQVDRAGG